MKRQTLLAYTHFMMLIILNVLYSLWGTFDDLAYTNIERKGFLSGVFCAGANKNIHTYTHTHAQKVIKCFAKILCRITPQVILQKFLICSVCDRDQNWIKQSKDFVKNWSTTAKIKGSTEKKSICYHIEQEQGVVTYMLPVEAFVTEIKFFDL